MIFWYSFGGSVVGTLLMNTGIVLLGIFLKKLNGGGVSGKKN